MENVNVDSENDPGSFKHPLNVPHSSTPSTSSETASPSSISRPTSHPSSSNASEKAALRFPSLPNLSESPVTTSDENLSEKVGATKVVTKSKALDNIVGSLSKTQAWQLYRNGKPETSVICQYVRQSVLFVQPIRSLI